MGTAGFLAGLAGAGKKDDKKKDDGSQKKEQSSLDEAIQKIARKAKDKLSKKNPPRKEGSGGGA